jgi:hypothetical protein
MNVKFSLALGLAAISAHAIVDQNRSGNILTGEVKASVVKCYSWSGLPKPDKILIRDFAVPVGDITTDESIAEQLHREILLRHGVDEDSCQRFWAQRVQAAFGKALATVVRGQTIATRVTPEELAEVEESEGKTVAEWLRDLALRSGRQRPVDPVELLLAELIVHWHYWPLNPLAGAS